MKGTQKYERIIWKKGVVALALSHFMGPTILGPGIGYSHIGQSIKTCFHCMKYLVVLIIIGAKKSKRIKLQHDSF